MYSQSKYFTRFVSSVLLISFLVLSLGKGTHASSCMPTCSPTDARFLLLVVGTGFQTLTTETLNLRIVVPGDKTEFSLGIFDGDSEPGLAESHHWDTGAPFLHSYTLKVDPDMDNNGTPFFEALSTNLPDNAWMDYSFPTNELARNADGDFVYTMTVTAQEPLDPIFPFVTANSFKLRSSGIIQIDEIFTFVSESTSMVDFGIIYPNLDDSNGVGPEDKEGANYDGTFSFFFDVEEGAIELEFWDGDADRGNFDGTQTDTDDPNTPNTIPSFAPLSTDVVPQGVNPPNPFDDLDPNSDFNFLVLQEGPVSYLTLFPDGQVFDNINPSGNREWEKWLISTITSNPAIADRMAPVIPGGEYEVRFEGLDINNFVSIRPLTAFRGEVISDNDNPTEVPTISQWGLLALTVAFGIIGVITVRRRQQAS